MSNQFTMQDPPQPRGLIKFTASMPENTVVFHTNGAERLRIAPDGFYIDGVRLDDPYRIYDRFHDWLISCGHPTIKPTRRKHRKNPNLCKTYTQTTNQSTKQQL